MKTFPTDFYGAARLRPIRWKVLIWKMAKAYPPPMYSRTACSAKWSSVYQATAA